MAAASACACAIDKRWLVRRPRFSFHFTPTYSSWMNLVERWFSEPTTEWLRRVPPALVVAGAQAAQGAQPKRARSSASSASAAAARSSA